MNYWHNTASNFPLQERSALSAEHFFCIAQLFAAELPENILWYKKGVEDCSGDTRCFQSCW